jgi:hypothetical protein
VRAGGPRGSDVFPQTCAIGSFTQCVFAGGGRPKNAARISTVSRSWAGVIWAAFFRCSVYDHNSHSKEQTTRQQSESDQETTRKQSAATSSWPNTPQHIPQHMMPQQRAFVGAQKPQQRANNQKATRKQPERNQKATSSWPNIPTHIPQHIPQRIPPNIPQPRAFGGAHNSHSKEQPTRTQPENNQKATRKQPENNHS